MFGCAVLTAAAVAQLMQAAAATRSAGAQTRPAITVVLIACGERYVRAIQATAESALAWSPAGAVEIVVVHDAPALEAIRSHMPGARRIQVRGGDEGSFSREHEARFMCSREKLTLPDLPLAGADLVVVLDADTLVAGDLSELAWWFHAHAGNAVWAAFAAESTSHWSANWYRCCSKVDYYRPNGINAGVAVFSLAAWRRLKPNLTAYFRADLPLGDQDVFNAYFQQHRHQMAELPPAWNWRGRGVSGLAPEDARILHAPGTQCARHNDCTKEFLFAALGRQRPAKKKPKKQ